MARNRKRAKERRVRQTQPVVNGRGRERRAVDDDRPENGAGARVDDNQERLDGLAGSDGEEGAPNPLEHAAPDVELAEVQLATASPLDADGDGREDEVVPQPAVDDAAAQEELEPDGPMADGGPSARAASVAVPASHSTVAAPRQWLGARLVSFLEGSWRELQRVQWPDRRQVMQATGVVIGFVIVASVFLGVADLVAGKVVHFILNGHF